MRLLKNPLFYFNVVLVVVIGLLITSVNANQTNFPALAKKAIAAVQQIIGQGEINKLAAFSGTNTIGNSQIFDNGTNVGVGTIFPLGKLHVVTDVAGDYVGVSNSAVSTFSYITQSGDLVGTGTGYANDFCTWGGKCLSAVESGGGGTAGVSRIIAGNGVKISPITGTGTVTISATSGNSGVSKIIAGNNITISPSGGTGDVTVSSINPNGVYKRSAADYCGGTAFVCPSGLSSGDDGIEVYTFAVPKWKIPYPNTTGGSPRWVIGGNNGAYPFTATCQWVLCTQ